MTFFEPWTGTAKAYHTADSMDALWHGVRRKRKPLTVLVEHAGLTDHVCAACGVALDAPYTCAGGSEPTVDRGGHAYVDVDPRAGVAVIRHYYCAWSSTMTELMKLGRMVTS